MDERPAERKLAAILSADVEGYSRLMGEDELGTVRALTEYREGFRIGINLGDVIVQGERLYGDGVNIAARLEGLAGGGDICLSGTAYDQIEGKLPFTCEFAGEHTVKNIARPVRVYRLRLDPSALSTPSPRSSARRVRGIAAAAAILLLLGAGGWAGWQWLRP